MRKMLQHFTHAQCKMSDKDGCSRLSIGIPKFRKLAGRLGLSDKDLECIACDVQFLEDNMDK